MSQRKYSEQQIDAFAREVFLDGFCILRNHYPKNILLEWRKEFQPMLEKQRLLEGEKTSRGSNRYYVTLPFSGIFADPTFYEDEDILAIVERIAGNDFTMCQ